MIDTAVGDASLGNQQLAQVFTAGRSGLLTASEFPLECVNFAEPPAGIVTLEVRSVEASMPADTVLSTATFQPDAFPLFYPIEPPYLRRLTLSAAVPVTAGVQYALVLQFATTNGTSCGVAQGPEGNPYGGGDGWYREAPWGWAPLGDRFDLPFRTLMQEESRTSVFHKNRQWICIERSSLSDHLAHGDTVWTPGCRR